MIKKYNQFINESKLNENDEQLSGNEVEDNRVYDEVDNEIKSDSVESDLPEIESEEEGNEYIGKKMIDDLSKSLDVSPNTDGSIDYNGKKINFYSETEKFHVDNKKFKTVEEVVNYLENSGIFADEEADQIKNDEIYKDMDREESKFESKSYKSTRKFESYKKK